ncbi:type IV pilus biogenesis protein PilM [Chloroflexota bacterium]
MTVSLSFDGNSLRVVTAKGKKVEKWDSVSFDPSLFKEGVITDAARMAPIIKQALSEKKLSTKNVRWSLPSIGSSSQVLTLPKGGKTSLELTVQREARRVLSVSPESSHLYWQQLPGSNTEQRVYVVAIPKESVQTLISTCQLAGVTIGSIDLRSLALARAINQKDAVIAHGEVNSVEMVIVLDSVPILTRGIWLREKNLDTGKVAALFLQQIAGTMDYYNDINRSNPLPSDVPIYLTGEIALDPDLAQRVSTLSGRTVADLEPPLSYPPNFPVAFYMSNIGIILKS